MSPQTATTFWAFGFVLLIFGELIVAGHYSNRSSIKRLETLVEEQRKQIQELRIARIKDQTAAHIELSKVRSALSTEIFKLRVAAPPSTSKPVRPVETVELPSTTERNP
jgi:hypothetical protein